MRGGACLGRVVSLMVGLRDLGEGTLDLVEQVEVHVLLLLLFRLGLGGSGSGTAAAGSIASCSGGTAATGRHGGELLGASSDDLGEVLARQLADELVDVLGGGLDADSAKDGVDVGGSGGGLAPEDGQQVSGNHTHLVVVGVAASACFQKLGKEGSSMQPPRTLVGGCPTGGNRASTAAPERKRRRANPLEPDNTRSYKRNHKDFKYNYRKRIELNATYAFDALLAPGGCDMMI